MRATRIASAILALALALAFIGCKGDEQKDSGKKKVEKKAKVKKERAPAEPVDQPGDEPGGDPPKLGEQSRGEPVLLETEALAMIPGSAIMVGAVAGVAPLAGRLGWADLRTIKRDWYEMAVAMVVQFIGHNLLDFKNLQEIGVDPKAPIGFAWLSWEDEAFAAWIRLTDQEKFKLTLYKLAGLAKEEVRPETMGDALILSFRGEDEVKIVLRGDFAFLVFSDDGEEEAMGHARRVASIDRAGSILEVERFKTLMGALDTGRDGAMYMDVAAILDNALGRTDMIHEETKSSWVENELKDAKARGADPEEIARLTKQVEEETAWQKRYAKRRKAEADLARSLWGSLGAVAMGAEIGKDSVFTHSIAAVGGGMALELFGRSDGRPLITKVVSGRPWFLAGATVDVATYRSLFEKLLQTEGTDWDEVEEETQKLLGVSLAKDVLALLDGQVGMYVGGKFLPRGEPSESFREVEAGGYIGVKDAGKVTALLEKIATHPEVAKLVKAGDGGWEVEVPQWRTVYVKVVDGYLAAATDAAFVDRVAKGAGGDWPASTGNDDLGALFTGSDANAAWMMDMGLIGFMTFARMGMGMDARAAEALGPGDAPHSQAWQDKDKEIKDAEKAVKEARERLENEEFEVLRAMFSAFGVTAMVGGPAENGLQAHGGQYFGLESIPEVAKEIAKRAFEMEALSSRRNTEIWQRQDEVWRMREELRQIRQKDVEDHLRKKVEEEKKAAEEAAKKAAEELGKAGGGGSGELNVAGTKDAAAPAK